MTIPYVLKGVLHQPDGSPVCVVGPKTGWLDWLRDERHRSFRFEGAGGMNCTVLKEKRKTRSGETRDYWYAHRHVFGKLKRVYLGKPERLTLSGLSAAAVKLAQLEMDVDGEDVSQDSDTL